MELFGVKEEHLIVFTAFSFIVDDLNESRIQRWYYSYKKCFTDAIDFSIVEDNRVLFCHTKRQEVKISSKLGGLYISEDANRLSDRVYDIVYNCLYSGFGSDVHITDDLVTMVYFENKLYSVNPKNKLVLEEK